MELGHFWKTPLTKTIIDFRMRKKTRFDSQNFLKSVFNLLRLINNWKTWLLTMKNGGKDK